jgi:hypothetical protein
LCNAVLHDYGHHLPGRTLQIACAYGDLTPRLVDCVAPGGSLEIVDILPIQLENLASKLAPNAPIKLHCMDSAALTLCRRELRSGPAVLPAARAAAGGARKNASPRRCAWSVRAAR